MRYRRVAPSICRAKSSTPYRPWAERLEDRCLLSAAVLDASFGQNGLATIPSLPPGTAASRDLVQQSDGKIVVAGLIFPSIGAQPQLYLDRFNADGSLDKGFGTGGVIMADVSGTPESVGVAVGPNNTILTATASQSGQSNQLIVVLTVHRFTSAGTPDSTFGSTGVAQVQFGANAGFETPDITALAVQPDGRIVAGGTVGDHFAVVRLNANGTPDNSFGGGGLVTSDLGQSQASVADLELQPDGRIVAVGKAGISVTAGGQSFSYALARYNADGTLDSGFGHGGTVTGQFNQDNTNLANAVALQPDGKILVAGAAAEFNPHTDELGPADSGLVRYNADGTLDTSFGTGGKIVTGGNGFGGFSGVVVRPTGEIVAAGNSMINQFTPAGQREFGTPVAESGGGLALTAAGRLLTTSGNSVAGYNVIAGGNDLFVTGADAGGGPNVQVYDATTNKLVRTFFAYAQGFTGGVRVASADVNGDGTPDVITAPGPGGGPDIHVYDGATGQLLKQFFAFDPRFSAGCFVAAADVNADGFADIIVGADAGGGPNVTIFSGKDFSLLRSFFPYAMGFTGGVRVAAGRVLGSLDAQVVTGAGPGGGPNVSVYRGDGTLVSSFFAFDFQFTAGVYVTTADINGMGAAQIVIGAGAGGGPNVTVFAAAKGTFVNSFFPYDMAFTGGVRVGSVLGPDGRANILSVPGPGGGPDVRIVNGVTLNQLDDFFAYDQHFTGGLYVAGTVH